MLRKSRYIFLFALLLMISGHAGAQCFSYARHVCKAQLKGYVPDGNYNATILSEGETAEIHKTFYSGQEYRVVICKVDSLPPVYFQVIDEKDNVLFDSKDHDKTNSWNFILETTQKLIIRVKVTEKDKFSMAKVSGCIAVMFSIKKD